MMAEFSIMGELSL